VLCCLHYKVTNFYRIKQIFNYKFTLLFNLFVGANLHIFQETPTIQLLNFLVLFSIYKQRI
jgi:hypothetical protein